MKREYSEESYFTWGFHSGHAHQMKVEAKLYELLVECDLPLHSARRCMHQHFGGDPNILRINIDAAIRSLVEKKIICLLEQRKAAVLTG